MEAARAYSMQSGAKGWDPTQVLHSSPASSLIQGLEGERAMEASSLTSGFLSTNLPQITT